MPTNGQARIRTVLGDIEPSALGRALAHEHIFCNFYRVTGRLNELLNDEELAALRDASDAALVEVTTPDMGRKDATLKVCAVWPGKPACTPS